MIKILFLAANPRHMPLLDLQAEADAIAAALRTAQYGGHFEFATEHAVRVDQLQELLLKHRPQVVHFSGHGSADGEIILADERGEPRAVTPDALAETFRLLRGDLRCVVINACHSQPQAAAIAQHVAGVVGMAAPLEDRASIVFSTAFYRALAFGEDLQTAFDLARNQLQHEHPGAANIPRLIAGRADLSRMKLATETPPAEWVGPRAGLSDAHRKYLRSLFDQKWAGVSLSLFALNYGKRLSLLDIFTPLPVDFAITLRADAGGRSDWWCGRRGEDPARQAEAEVAGRSLFAAMSRRLRRGKEDAQFVRQRRWADLDADDKALGPLVALAAKALADRKAERGSERDGERQIVWEADAHHAALVQTRFVLIGDPGSGKSTFLRHLALCWAGAVLPDAPPTAGLHVLAGWTGPAYIPLYIELRSLVAGEAWSLDRATNLPGVAELRAYVRTQLAAEGNEPFADELFDLLRRGRAAILLDGLDEVNQGADARRRAQVQAFVGELAEKFPGAPIIVTARPYAYRQGEWRLAGFGRTELTPLDRPRQAELAGRLFRKLPMPNAEREAAAFVENLAQIPEDLAGNPLLLTLLIAIWLNTDPCHRCLPSTRGELYRRGLDLLLEDWVSQKVEGFSLEREYALTAKDLRFVLQLVAYEAQRRRTEADEIAVISRGEIFEALETIGQGDIAAGLLRHLKLRAGMLLESVEQSPGTLVAVYTQQFRFLHLSFQEYLAACELLYREGDVRPYRLPVWPDRRFPHALVGRVTQAPTLWANVLRLATDELLSQEPPRTADAWELLSGCCEPYRAAGAAGEAVGVALQVAEEAGLFDGLPERRLRADYEDLRAAALKALADFKGLAPEQRDVAGRLLGAGPRGDDKRLVGPCPGHDTRPGVGLRQDGLPDIDWVPIPNDGAFTYQKNERRAEPDFWIARYPVTYAQYRAFLEAKDGFRNPRWWRGLAAPKEDRKQPGEQRFSHWNHPAENVSWHDAVAFCRWLTAQVQVKVEVKAEGWEKVLPPGWDMRNGLSVTLPTEWQWEKAARGHDGRQFPWGKEYVSGYANIDETASIVGTKVGSHYLQKTSAVGMYPQGASPYGMLDMSGNIWEWCLNEGEKPERIQEEGNANRVRRGGSWHHNEGSASALARPQDWRLIRNANLGFRVVGVAVVPFS